MARVHKFLLRTGNHEAPQGTLRATAERMKSWADKFHRMQGLGIKIPCCWGHHADALPADAAARARQQADRARFTAGYLEDVAFDPKTGDLSVSMDLPGAEADSRGNLLTWQKLPDGRQVRCAIGEVSAAFRSWRDGSGRDWPDVLAHVGLVTHPVVMGQDGFKQLSTAAEGAATYLSLVYLGADMAEEKKPGKEFPPAEGAPPDAPEAAETPPGPPPEVPPAAPEVPPDPHFGAALAALQGLGLHLLPDTTPANFAERILVACHALDKGKEGEPEEEGEETDPEDSRGREYKGPTQEEQRPVMMSLSTAGLTPRERKMLALEQAKAKGSILARIDRLQKAGRIPPPDADRLRAGLSGYTLSLDEDLKPAEGPVEVELSIWERVTKGLGAARGKGLKGAREEERPVPSEAARLKAQEEAGDELAALAGAPARK